MVINKIKHMQSIQNKYKHNKRLLFGLNFLFETLSRTPIKKNKSILTKTLRDFLSTLCGSQKVQCRA